MLKIFSFESTRDFNGFSSLRSVIGPDKSRHLLNQSDVKPKANCDLDARVFPHFDQFACF